MSSMSFLSSSLSSLLSSLPSSLLSSINSKFLRFCVFVVASCLLSLAGSSLLSASAKAEQLPSFSSSSFSSSSSSSSSSATSSSATLSLPSERQEALLASVENDELSTVKRNKQQRKKRRSKKRQAPSATSAPSFSQPVFSENQPRLLSLKDAATYKRIFALQKEAQWKKADKLAATLKNKVLLGHISFQRYMHPRSYRSNAAELKRWLARYSDHPNAARLYRLAYKRTRKGKRAALKRPSAPVLPPSAKAVFEVPSKKRAPSRYNRAERRTLYRLRRFVHRTRVSHALRYLQARKGSMRPRAYAKGTATVVAGYFFNGFDEKALALAEEQAHENGKLVPDLHWWAGLAAFRLNRFERAAWHFEQATTLNTSPNSSMAAQAAYWGARTYLRNGKPDQSSRLLKVAHARPHSFYGQLATETLGYESRFDWKRVPQKKENFKRLVSFPAGKRAIALMEAEQYRLAAQEVVRFLDRLPDDMRVDYMVYAYRRGQADLAYRLGLFSLREEGKRFDAVLYPLPKWQPSQGFNLEPALLYAFMRQESAFKPYARSRVGATGLMQLMPRTAQYMANRKLSGQFLRQPEDNLALGQKYLQFLMNDANIGKNLVFAAASYNGGPGNVLKWVSKGKNYRQDPLLFVETIPLRETRHFVRKILSNYWIYQHRLGSRTPSRKALAAGRWPLYENHVPYPQDLAHKFGKLR